MQLEVDPHTHIDSLNTIWLLKVWQSCTQRKNELNDERSRLSFSILTFSLFVSSTGSYSNLEEQFGHLITMVICVVLKSYYERTVLVRNSQYII